MRQWRRRRNRSGASRAQEARRERVKLTIRNFKSIRELDAECARINVFAGKPGAGTSNILEALGILGHLQSRRQTPLDQTVRHEHLGELFHRRDESREIEVRLDRLQVRLRRTGAAYSGDGQTCTPWREHVGFRIHPSQDWLGGLMHDYPYPLAHTGKCPEIRFYRFRPDPVWLGSPPEHLSTPRGCDLPHIMERHHWLREILQDRLTELDPPAELGWEENGLRFQENGIELPTASMPDSLRAYALTMAAILTNEDAMVVLEEPESGLSPLDRQHVAETIARTESGGHFLSTRSQSFLSTVVAKAPAADLALWLVHRENGMTAATRAPRSVMPLVFEMNLWANFENFLEEAREQA